MTCKQKIHLFWKISAGSLEEILSLCASQQDRQLPVPYAVCGAQTQGLRWTVLSRKVLAARELSENCRVGIR